MRRVEELLTLEEAQALVLERARPLDAESVPIAKAAGRVLAAPATAVVDLPPFPSSAMDGYAVRAADTPGTLPVVFRVAAGVPAARPLEAGEAMGIATGGVVPEGADAVIQHERVVESGNTVEIPQAVASKENIRPVGRDVRAGAVVVAAGVRLGPSHIGALAAAGVAEVTCARRPRIAVLMTGTELRPPGSPLGPGEVYEANGVMVAAQLEAAGAVVTMLAAVADDRGGAPPRDRAGARSRCAGHVGWRVGRPARPRSPGRGRARGRGDLLACRRATGQAGVVRRSWVDAGVRAAGQPGLDAGRAASCSSARPCSHFRARPTRGPAGAAGRLATTVGRNPGRDDLLRARSTVTDDGVVLEPVTGQESHMIVRAAEADALVLVPRGEGELPAGSPVRYLPV